MLSIRLTSRFVRSWWSSLVSHWSRVVVSVSMHNRRVSNMCLTFVMIIGSQTRLSYSVNWTSILNAIDLNMSVEQLAGAGWLLVISLARKWGVMPLNRRALSSFDFLNSFSCSFFMSCATINNNAKRLLSSSVFSNSSIISSTCMVSQVWNYPSQSSNFKNKLIQLCFSFLLLFFFNSVNSLFFLQFLYEHYRHSPFSLGWLILIKPDELDLSIFHVVIVVFSKYTPRSLFNGVFKEKLNFEVNAFLEAFEAFKLYLKTFWWKIPSN